MKLKDIQHIFHSELDQIYGEAEVNSLFFLVVEFYYNLPRFQLALKPDYAITKSEQDLIVSALNDLKLEKPIQYILGETEFYGLKFKVNEGVLIPRPETEELVDWVKQSVTSSAEEKSLNILDIGTGSGCIAISLAKNLPKAKVYAIDVSERALKVARQNAELNKVEIEFIKADILNVEVMLNFPALSAVEVSKHNLMTKKFDVIVSNPPYVRQLEKEEMKPNVLQNEPHLALFVDDENPLRFYDAISSFAVDNLKPTGSLFFEINEYLGNEMIGLLKSYDFKAIQLKKDLFGKDRMVKAMKSI